MRKELIFVLLLLLSSPFLSAAMMSVHLISEETVDFLISEIDQITFADESLLIHLTSTAVENFGIVEIDRITFCEDLSVEELVEFVSKIPIRLLGNYPNPFNPETTISFEIAQPGRTIAEVYNVKGQKVRVLLDEMLGTGSHSIVWDGRNDRNRKVSSGMYLYRVSVNGAELYSRMIMLK